MEALNALPPVTRTLLLAVAGCTIPVLLAIMPVYPLVFVPHKIFGKAELWRLLTPFFYGGSGIPLVFDVFLLYRNASDLEERHFQRKTAEFAWALIIVCGGIIGLNTPLQTPILFHPFLMALTHIWAQTNATAQVSLFGLINMPAPYFPFALLGIDLVKGGPSYALQSFTGLAAAHAWYFLSTIYPAQNGGRGFGFMSPPQWLATLLATPPAPNASGAQGSASTYRAGALEPIDPHYETFTDSRGRTKSRKRGMPVGLSKKDERILRSVRRRAHYLDKAQGFSLCGFRFGWTAIFGLIPFAGDVVAFLLSYFLVLNKCREADLPVVLEQRMVFNQMISVGVGMVPLVGDIILAVWKTNSRNAALLEEFLIARANAPAPSGVAGGKTTAQVEQAAAETALNAPGISHTSGERVGGKSYQISPEVLAEDEGVAHASGSSSAPPAGKRGWYGWGGKADPTDKKA
ncbi:hypothetical protein RQP46_009981 [Phenoliferia psychrophenolica]